MNREAILSIIQNQWFHALIILAGFYLGAKLAYWIFVKIFQKLAEKTVTNIDDELIDKTKKPISTLIFVIGLRMAFLPLKIPEKIYSISTKIIESILIIVIFYIIIKVVDVLIDTWGKAITERTKSTMDDELLPLFHKFCYVILIIICFLVILTKWGVEITPLLASLGIAGLAISFALKDTLANIFGGISLILDKNFKVGDQVKLETGEEGEVSDIGLRSTKVRTWDNEMLIVPNGILANQRIINYAQPESIERVVVPFSVAYGSQPENVKKVVLDALKKEESILKNPEPSVRFLEMGESSLNFKAYVWTKNFTERLNLKETTVQIIYLSLNKAKIEIPFPQRVVYLKKE